MKRGTICLIVLVALLSNWSCDEPEVVPEPELILPDSVNLGIHLAEYQPDSIYLTDTIQYAFYIINNGPVVLPKGAIIETACQFDEIIFSLDLLGPGPTALELPDDLNVGDSFFYDAGYLLSGPTLDYFFQSEMTTGVLVYGLAGMVTDTTFADDYFPADNQSLLHITDSTISLIDE